MCWEILKWFFSVLSLSFNTLDELGLCNAITQLQCRARVSLNLTSVFDHFFLSYVMDGYGKLTQCVLQLHVLSPFMTYHRVCSKSNTTEFTLCFQRCLYCSISSFRCSLFFGRCLSVLLDLRLLITPCGIFKLFLIPKDIHTLLYTCMSFFILHAISTRDAHISPMAVSQPIYHILQCVIPYICDS